MNRKDMSLRGVSNLGIINFILISLGGGGKIMFHNNKR